MTDQKPAGNNRSLLIAIVAIAAIAVGVFVYEQNHRNQQTFTVNLGGQTISATVDQPK